MDCNVCRQPNANPADIAKCAGYALRNIAPADVEAYAQRSGANGHDELCMVKSNLLAGRLMYWKNQPGDCPQPTKVNLGAVAGLTKGLGLAGTGVAAASSVGLAATGGAGVGASAAGSGAALGGLPSIFGAIAGPAALVAIPLAIWGIISAHHKVAVAREQATICDVSQAYNQWEDAMESGLVTGAVTPTDAKRAILVLEPQLTQALQAIVKGGCNAACYFQKALKALNLYAVEKLYDSLAPRPPAGNPANVAAASVFLPKANLATYGLAAAGGLAGFKLAGVLV